MNEPTASVATGTLADEDNRSSLEGEITEFLSSWREPGMPPEDLVRCVYPHLRYIAAGQLSSSVAGSRPFDTTELVHEAFLKLADQRLLTWRNRSHFFAVAARLIRRVVVDKVRQRQSHKRGGAAARVDLHDEILAGADERPDLLALDQALDRLGREHVTAARVVELRYFAGLTISEAAETLGLGRTTVIRHWRWARAWLRAELASHRSSSDAPTISAAVPLD